MDDNYYFVFDVSYNGLRYAYYDRIEESKNLLSLFVKELEVVLPCKTMKQAQELADSLNERYKEIGILWKDFIHDDLTLDNSKIVLHPTHFSQGQLIHFCETHKHDLIDIIKEV